jgi:hypothetical protein
VKADEIFILLLMLVCLGIVAASAIHSRRRGNATDTAHSPIEENVVVSAPPVMDDNHSARRSHGKKRRTG